MTDKEKADLQSARLKACVDALMKAISNRSMVDFLRGEEKAKIAPSCALGRK